MSQSNPPFTLFLSNFPQGLLLGKYSYDLIFNAVNNLNTVEKFALNAHGEGLSISTSKEFVNGVEFKPKESKQFNFKIQPQIDGFTTLNIDCSQIIRVEYTEMVWKVRDKVEKAIIQQLMAETLVPINNLQNYKDKLPNSFDNTGIITISPEQAKLQTSMIRNDVSLNSDDKDKQLCNIATGVFIQNNDLGFDILKMVQNPKTRDYWLIRFIPIALRTNSKRVTREVMEMTNQNEKDSCLEMIANTTVFDNPQDAAMIALNINNEIKRTTVLINIIFALITTNPDIATNLVYQIANENQRSKVLFEVIKKISEKNVASAVDSLKNLIMNVLSGANTDFIKKCAIFLAHLTNPQSVLDLVEKFNDQEKNILIEQLREYLKVQVQEKKIREDHTPIGKLSYIFTAVSTKYTNELEYLARLGGNLCPNLFNLQKPSNILFLNLFAYNFQYISGFQQAYLEIYREFQRTFNYIVFPSKNITDKADWDMFIQLSQKLILQAPSNSQIPQLIFNLDFIPYLSSPTIIFGENSPVVNDLAQKLIRFYGNQANILVDNTIFRGGKIWEDLQNLFPSPRFIVVNTLINYNFFSSYPLLKSFFQALTQ